MEKEGMSESIGGAEKPKAKRSKIVIGVVGLIMACCLGMFGLGTYLNSTPEGQATATVRAQEQQVTRAEQTAVAVVKATEEALPTNTTSPTDTPGPTNTSVPTNTPIPTATPTPLPIGLSRSNPYPNSEVVSAPNWDVQVLEVKRGDEAWRDIQAANMFNEAPPEGMEYLLVKLRVKSTYDDDNEHSISGCDFDVTGDRLILYTCGMAMVVEPAPQLDARLFTGGETEGWAAYLIAQNEGSLILVVNEVFNFDRDAIRYIAIDEGAALTVPSELASIRPTDIGKERANPALPTDTLITEDWEVSILEIIRGDAAWKMVQEANQFNDPPEEGMEYIAVKVLARNISTEDRAQNIDGSFFKTTGDASILYDQAFVVDPEPSLDIYLYPDGEFEGWVVLQAGEGETGVVIIFEPIFEFSSRNKRFVAIEP